VPGSATVNAWATQRQAMYGIADDTATSTTLPNIRGTNGNTCPSGGGDGAFVCQSATTNAGTPITFSATTEAIDLLTRRGWYIDLPVTNGRVNTDSAITTTGTLVFSVNVPTSVTCDPGGNSYFFSLNATTGGAVARLIGGNTYYDAGTFLAPALASRPVIVQTAAGKRALIRLSDRSIANPLVPEPAGTAATWRRIYWRSLK
jgi:type IV pilus assembly protein PilY1